LTKTMNWKLKKTTTRKAAQVARHSRPSFPILLIVLFAATIFAASILQIVNPASAAPDSKKLKPNDPYALIFGTVWGPDNRPVYGIKVLIRQVPKKKPEWELYSDHAGEFAQRFAAGKADYVVGADLKGVKTAQGHALHLAQEVDVHVDYDERVDISLHLAE
jgi:hypothetical protein